MFNPKTRKSGLIMPFLGILLYTLSGCSAGPAFLKQGHLGYNESVKTAADRELLLNIVRIRYLDTIEFLAENSISTQTSMKIALGAELGAEGGDAISLMLPELEYSDRPTVTFTPQRGREFARRLTAPVDVENFCYLAASSWPIDNLLLLLGAEVNGLINGVSSSTDEYGAVARQLRQLQLEGKLLVGFLENDEIISGPITTSEVSIKDYLEIAKEGYRLQRSNDNNVAYLIKKTAEPVIWVENNADTADMFKTRLRINSNAHSPFAIRQGSGLYQRTGSYSSIVLRTRSLLGALLYLAQAVQLPADHEQQKIAPLSWPFLHKDQISLAGIFTIHSAKTKPPSGLAIQYRGYWFYLDDQDMHSKAMFMMMAEIYRLAISEGRAGQVPVLTLPVGE